jgi:hypothetical protein
MTKNNKKSMKREKRSLSQKVVNSIRSLYKIRIGLGSVRTNPTNVQAFHLATTGQLTSSAGGNVTSALTNNPSGAAEFSACSSLWDSYRVVRMIMEFIPVLTYNSGFAFPPMVVVFDPDTTTPPSTFAAGLQYDTHEIVDLTKHWWYEATPPKVMSASAITGSYTVNEGGFLDLGNPAGTSSISWRAEGCTSSTLYGTYVMHYFVDLISRR